MTMAGHPRLVKFGYTSRTPERRAKDGTLTPAPLQVVAAWQSPQAARLERLVLRRLNHCRQRGEWLNLPLIDLIDAIERTAEAHAIDIAPADFRRP